MASRSPIPPRSRSSEVSLRTLACLPALALPVLMAAQAADLPASERRSGYDFMSAETRAMQDDDNANPGMLWVLDGEALWRRPEGPDRKSCADCHGDAATGMNGVAARYPAYDAARSRPIDL